MQKSDIFDVILEKEYRAQQEYVGNAHLFVDPGSPLVCRCFGIREDEILSGNATRAGMGCRTCRPKVQRISRFYKELPFAEWLVLAEEKLRSFDHDWNFSVEGFKGKGILITHQMNVTQLEEEEMARKLQGFLAAALDSDLSFFLRRA